jgi:hypothetical protein
MKGFNDIPEAEDFAIQNVASRSSYQNFIEKLYFDIDCIISDLIDLTETLLPMPETGISGIIWSNLRAKNYDAQLDSHKNGNADISVTQKPYKWICEAKIYGGEHNYNNNYLYGGYQQLTTRYSKAEVNATFGGMFIYIKPRGRVENETTIMSDWKKFLESKQNEITDLNIETCLQNEGCFVSQQTHVVGGRTYSVRHMPLCLLHLPEDKSGLDAKKYNDARLKYENFDQSEENHW